MSASYGAKWSSQCGETFGESGALGAAWRSILDGLTPAQIHAGLRLMLNRHDPDTGECNPWPPSAVEFRALCLPKPAAAKPDEWKSNRADPRKIPSPERLAWHKANIAWIEAGGELPRPGAVEPPAPVGATPFWDIYTGPRASL